MDIPDRGQNVRVTEKHGRQVVTIRWFKVVTVFLLVFSCHTSFLFLSISGGGNFETFWVGFLWGGSN